MSLYVVDTNFFIQAHRATYPKDVVPSFWFKVRQLAEDGKLISIDKVKTEILENNDSLSKWCEENLPTRFFHNTSSNIDNYRRVIGWAVSRSNHYLPSAVNEFLSSEEADAFLIAFVLADLQNRIIVTQETSEPNRKNKIKIPDVARVFGIQYLSTIDMFRQLGETF